MGPCNAATAASCCHLATTRPHESGRGHVMSYPHLTVNTRGVLCIDGTRHRVIDIVADHVAHGYSAAQIVEQYPDLTLAQVHAALTYYYDHEDALNATLMASYAQAEQQRHQHQPHPKLVTARMRQAD